MNGRRFLLDFIAIIILAMLVPSPGRTAAQQPSSSNGVPAHMVVTVEARHGSDVPSINREDVMVYGGHDRDAVSTWVAAEGDRAALELFILLDDDSSVSLGPQLQDLRRFINSQPASTKIGVAYMQNGMARIQQNLTSDHGQAAKGLRLPLGMSGINASPYFSLGDLLKHWPESDARREVLMVSDGIDRYYGSGNLEDPYVASVIEQAQRAGVLVFAIYTPGVGHYGHSYWRSYWGQLYLSYVADETGGEGYYIGFQGPAVSFAPYLDDLTHRLNHQYLLTFLAKAQDKAGLRQVKVRTEIHNAELVAATRAYVPAGS
jgi:hypothetical protein